MQKQQAATVVHLQIRIDHDTQRQLCHVAICQVYTTVIAIVDIYFSGARGLDGPHQLVMATSFSSEFELGSLSI